uniref:PAM2 domain-containing protein n=1 Tax=Heterorhabditis bacteriophora TaxID=37862 RepID=A0A1I7XV38_HETBA
MFHSQQPLFGTSVAPSILCGPPPPPSKLLRGVPGVVPVSPPSVPSFFSPPPIPPQFRNASMMVPPGSLFPSSVPSRTHVPPFVQSPMAAYNIQKSTALSSLYSAVTMAPPPPAPVPLNLPSTTSASSTLPGQPLTFQADADQMPSVVSGYLPENHGAAGFGAGD